MNSRELYDNLCELLLRHAPHLTQKQVALGAIQLTRNIEQLCEPIKKDVDFPDQN